MEDESLEDRVTTNEIEIAELRQLVTSQTVQIETFKQVLLAHNLLSTAGSSTAAAGGGRNSLERENAELRRLVLSQGSQIEALKQTLRRHQRAAGGNDEEDEDEEEEDEEEEEEEESAASRKRKRQQLGYASSAAAAGAGGASAVASSLVSKGSSSGGGKKSAVSAGSTGTPANLRGLTATAARKSIGSVQSPGGNVSSEQPVAAAAASARKNYWTSELDDLLREAVAEFGTSSWSVIANHVGNGRNNEQCSSRWRKHVSPRAVEKKRLRREGAAAVAAAGGAAAVGGGAGGQQQQQPGGASASVAAADDDADEAEAEEEEDGAVAAAAAGSTEKGYWTEDLDDRLRLAVTKYGTSNWKTVAEFVGGGKTNGQCSSRWRKHVSPEAVERKSENKKKRPWDAWEDELLKAFIVTNKKVEHPKEPIDVNWAGISKLILGRSDYEIKKHMGVYNLPCTLKYSQKALVEVNRVRQLVELTGNKKPSASSSSSSSSAAAAAAGAGAGAGR